MGCDTQKEYTGRRFITKIYQKHSFTIPTSTNTKIYVPMCCEK